MSSLNLNKHARDKMMRLVGERYDEESDVLTIVTDRCPMRKQNHDYGIYVLTALYHESNVCHIKSGNYTKDIVTLIWFLQTFEEWERQKQESDMEFYIWENNLSKKAYVALMQWPQKVSDDDVKSYSIDNDIVGQKYKEAVTELFNNGKSNI